MWLNGESIYVVSPKRLRVFVVDLFDFSSHRNSVYSSFLFLAEVICSANTNVFDIDTMFSVFLSELEPPVPRPKTSARTAQRLIAQGMGIKFSTDFGSNELRKQEDARKSRILARQSMKDDAWGSD